MTRLTITLTDEQLKFVDSIMSATEGYRPNARQRAEAVPGLLGDYAGLRDEYDRVTQQRDREAASCARATDTVKVLESRLDAARAALKQERARHAASRGRLDKVTRTAERLRTSRDRYRHLALAVDAALAGRDRLDAGANGLVERIGHALHRLGFRLPEPAAQDAAGSSGRNEVGSGRR